MSLGKKSRIMERGRGVGHLSLGTKILNVEQGEGSNLSLGIMNNQGESGESFVCRNTDFRVKTLGQTWAEVLKYQLSKF